MLLTITSFDQEPGGVLGYSEGGSILPLLDEDAQEALLRGRESVRNWLLSSDDAVWQGRRMSEDARNRSLVHGPDLGGTDSTGLYLPAVRRFTGGFFHAMGDDGRAALIETKHHVLMLCGLYGLKTPAELVQWHNCPVEPHLGVCRLGTRENLLTDLLLAYIRAHSIRRAVDLTALQWRRDLINWSDAHGELPGGVLHCHNREGAGDFALAASAHLARESLLSAPEEEVMGIRAGDTRSPRGNTVCFHGTDRPPEGYAQEQWLPIRDDTDRAARVRMWVVRLVNWMAGHGQLHDDGGPDFWHRAQGLVRWGRLTPQEMTLLGDACGIRNSIVHKGHKPTRGDHRALVRACEALRDLASREGFDGAGLDIRDLDAD